MDIKNDYKLIKQIIIREGKELDIPYDIIEKDYYVCLMLKDLASKQDELKAYFKGGTAVYKILDEMYRFSEDIDLTVKVLEEESNTRNQKRLKLSAFDYNIEGLELDKDKCIDKKGSIISFYKYNSMFLDIETPLDKANEVQIESTSFTVSEPTKKYTIMPLIYKLANDDERKILKERYGISEFDIEIIKLERIFIDKIFAAEFYYIRKDYQNVSKHLYDINTLLNECEIINFLKDKERVKKIINYKREEELVRLGGIDSNVLISDFTYLKFDYPKEMKDAFEKMQDIYVISDEYKYELDKVIENLKKLKKVIEEIE